MAGLFFKDAVALHETYRKNPKDARSLDDALLNYRKGLALRPDDVEMHYQLGRLLMSVNRKPDAEPHLRYYLRNGTQVRHLDDARKWLGEE